MIPNLISTVELTVNLTGSGPTSMVDHANDEAAAEQVLSIINDANQKYQANLKAQLAEQAASDDPVERAFAQYAERISGSWATQNVPTREGATLTLFHTDGLDESQKKMLVAGLGIATAALLPATMSARQAARSAQATNNMKQIMLAWHNYHSTKRAFPPHANYSDDGQPLLSWRVHILPFLEEGAGLYEQFKLDEPWDSEHNKALIARMPQVYANPNLPLEPGKTNYVAVVGTDCVMDGTKDGTSMKRITDGTSMTVAFVEANPDQAAIWTQPDDLEFNAEDPKAGLGNVRPGGWYAAFSDGSVQLLDASADPDTVRKLFTRADGEPVEIPRAAEIGPPRPPGGPAFAPVPVAIPARQ
jgi:hypothetical protein